MLWITIAYLQLLGYKRQTRYTAKSRLYTSNGRPITCSTPKNLYTLARPVYDALLITTRALKRNITASITTSKQNAKT